MYLKFSPLLVSDQDRAIAFYTRHLGLSVAKDAAYSSDWRWVELALPGAQTKLLMEKRKNADRSERPDLAISVEDIQGLFQSMQADGIEFQGEPTSSQWDKNELSVLFYDSEGNLVLLTERTTKS